MNVAITVIALCAAIAAAMAAFGSWSAAMKMTVIERDRRHGELTPRFQITFMERANAAGYADLRVILTGGGMERLDEVTVTILDDTEQDHWAHGLPDGVTQERASAFVWGPWQLDTGASDQVLSNRTTKPWPCSRVSGKNWNLYSLERTRPGFWMTGTDEATWRREQAGPLRLLLTCHRDGYEPWTLLQDIPTVPERPAFS